MKNFVVWIHVKADNIYKDIAESAKTRIHTSNHELDKPLPKEKIRN